MVKTQEDLERKIIELTNVSKKIVLNKKLSVSKLFKQNMLLVWCGFLCKYIFLFNADIFVLIKNKHVS